MGNENAVSLGRLQEETQAGMYDILIHNGDIAYDMENVRKYTTVKFARKKYF